LTTTTRRICPAFVMLIRQSIRMEEPESATAKVHRRADSNVVRT
jgi:hypothetical protein